MCSKVTYIKTGAYNSTGVTHEYYFSCDFGDYRYTCSTNDTSTLSNQYITELVIFKV